jgi:hypothetical protein
MQPRRPPSLPSTCGVFPGLSSFPHFERDPHGPDIHSRVGTRTVHGAVSMARAKAIDATAGQVAKPEACNVFWKRIEDPIAQQCPRLRTMLVCAGYFLFLLHHLLASCNIQFPEQGKSQKSFFSIDNTSRLHGR